MTTQPIKETTLARQKKNRVKFKHRHPIIHTTAVASTIVMALGLVGTGVYVENVLDETPTITEHQLRSDGSSNMYDANGKIIWSSTETRRDYVKFKDVPKSYIDLLLATENDTYYQDAGFSWKGLANAFLSTFKAKVLKQGEARGGSSIEQQLIKNVAFSTDAADRTVNRKIKELWLAYQLDKNFSKDQILEFYINKINMGENSYGADTISMTYFGKHLNELSDPTPQNLSKLAIIAGLGQAPSRYNLYDNPEAVKERRDIVLLSALNKEKITRAQYEEIKKVPVQEGLKERYWRNVEVQAQVAKYNAYISGALRQIESLGYDIKQTPLQIKTHLNPEKQDWLTAKVNSPIYQDAVQQVAVTVTDTKTGVVLAQSGGRNEEANGLNRAIQTSRSSGSTIKPFIAYGPAIEYLGFASSYSLDSSPYRYPGTNLWANNYGGYTYGAVTMSYALSMSLNTPVNRLLDEVLGSQYAKSFLGKVGLDVQDSYAGSAALGLNLSTAQFASAFAALANGGVYNSPQFVKEITFSDGSTKQITSENKRAMKDSTAFILAKMLQKGTIEGRAAQKLNIPEFAGHLVKTGQVGYDSRDGIWRPEFSSMDSWASGATKSVAVSIWTGYDSPNEPGHWIVQNNPTKEILYRDIMRYFNQGKDTSDWAQPQTVTNMGNGEYAPNTLINEINTPALPEAFDNSGILNNAKRYGKNTKFEQKTKDSGVPKDYKPEDWLNSLSEEDKKYYGSWLAGTLTTPELDDFTTGNVANFKQEELPRRTTSSTSQSTRRTAQTTEVTEPITED